MSLPKKGSSIIRVGVDEYRWMVSPDSGYMTIVVQSSLGRGRRLQIQTAYDVAITPSMIRQGILQALKAGWTPGSAGKPFQMRRLGPEGFEIPAATASKKGPAPTQRPKDDRKAGYTCPVCGDGSLRHNPDGFFACGGCGRTFLPDELREKLRD